MKLQMGESQEPQYKSSFWSGWFPQDLEIWDLFETMISADTRQKKLWHPNP